MKHIAKKVLGLIMILSLVIELPGIYGLAEMVEKKETVTDGRKNPENPVHHCMKNVDNTDWSYVYFGSYPQTEVRENAAIAGASYDANGDAVVDGIKYRRISKEDTKDSNFGDYEYRYFKWERIKWRILKNDGKTLFVVADQGLDTKKYHDPGGSITWENCTLRNWLNNDFYGMAFSSEEQKAIVPQMVVNEDRYDIEGGNDTWDKIFLLSAEEVVNPDYGFCKNKEICSFSRKIRASGYAERRGVQNTGDGSIDIHTCNWLLRSPGSSSTAVTFVTRDGDLFYYREVGGDHSYVWDGIVPALHIDLSSACWSLPEESNSPSNPVHYCTDGRDKTDWSYIYFGNYPQTEITGIELTAEIMKASYDTNGDAWVNGTKYRRISKNDTNSSDYFGESAYRYFKWERIKWRVLNVNESTMFVMADEGLDCKCYNEKFGSDTWETCTLRNWLNEEFYDTAFSNEEQRAIVPWKVENKSNSANGIEGQTDTTDWVYLPSVEEVTNPEYGFCKTERDGLAYSISRRIKASDYAHIRGAWRSRGEAYMDNCNWWLRSPRDVVYAAGLFGRDDIAVSEEDLTCVPVLHISLSSNFWSLTEDTDSLSNSVHQCIMDSDFTDWDYVYFGSYPQTEITGTELKKEIVEASYDTNGDAWVNGIKYRRISITDTYNDSNFGSSVYRYFKWERIKWRVLENNADTLFVMADIGLDCERYHDHFYNEGYYDDLDNITWEICTIRNWLNADFYNMAFNKEEQASIKSKDLVNEKNSLYGTTGGNDTLDNIFLLSISEITNPKYGFCKDYLTYSVSRMVKISDYAYVKGAEKEKNNSDWYCAEWQLRSPGEYNDYNALVNNYGRVCFSGISWKYDDDAVVPVLQISLSSDFWLAEDDGTSGSGGGLVSIKIPTTNPPSNQEQSPGDGGEETVQIGESHTVNEYTYKIINSTEVSFTGVKNRKKSSVTIPKTVAIAGKNYKVTKIEDNAFQKSQAKKVKIGENVKTIGAKAFYNCKKLTSVTIPSKVSKIGKQAFSGCKNLRKIEIKTTKLTMKNVGAKAFKGIHAKAKIKVPKKKKTAYKKLLQSKGAGKKVKF